MSWTFFKKNTIRLYKGSGRGGLPPPPSFVFAVDYAESKDRRGACEGIVGVETHTKWDRSMWSGCDVVLFSRRSGAVKAGREGLF